MSHKMNQKYIVYISDMRQKCVMTLGQKLLYMYAHHNAFSTIFQLLTRKRKAWEIWSREWRHAYLDKQTWEAWTVWKSFLEVFVYGAVNFSGQKTKHTHTKCNYTLSSTSGDSQHGMYVCNQMSSTHLWGEGFGEPSTHRRDKTRWYSWDHSIVKQVHVQTHNITQD